MTQILRMTEEERADAARTYVQQRLDGVLDREMTAAVEMISDGPTVELADAIEQAQSAMQQVARDAARKHAETHADAVRVVMRAKAREGHDLTATRPADALAIDIIRRALDDVRNAPAGVREDAFDASSHPDEIARGAAVKAAMTGGGQ